MTTVKIDITVTKKRVKVAQCSPFDSFYVAMFSAKNLHEKGVNFRDFIILAFLEDVTKFMRFKVGFRVNANVNWRCFAPTNHRFGAGAIPARYDKL